MKNCLLIVTIVLLTCSFSLAEERNIIPKALFEGYHGLGFHQKGKTKEQAAQDHMACKLKAMEIYPFDYDMGGFWASKCMKLKGYEENSDEIIASHDRIRAEYAEKNSK